MSQKIKKPRRQSTPKPEPVSILVFNNARFPVVYDSEGRTIPPQSLQSVILNEYVQRAIDKGLLAVRS